MTMTFWGGGREGKGGLTLLEPCWKMEVEEKGLEIDNQFKPYLITTLI